MANSSARSTLSEHFGRLGRSITLASELPVYYPDEPVFAPDLLAVLDVEPQERDHWAQRADRYAARLRELGIDRNDMS